MKSFLSKNTFWGLLIFLPVVLYFYFLSEYALNIPKWDDHALKAFIVDFQNTDEFVPKLQTFFKQHNEHRIAFDRFFTLIVFWIHGSIEYRWLMWIGNFTLLGVIFIFFRLFQKQKISIAYFVPIPLILFQMQLWENTFWGMAAMQNFGIIFFILALIYLISSEKKSHFYLALFVAFLATYTSGNGITVFPVCIVLLVVQGRFKDLTIFGIASSLLIFLYFFQYKFPENNPSMAGISLEKIILGFFSFLGSVFDLIPNANQSRKTTIFGGIILFVTSLIVGIYLLFNSKLFKKQRNLNQTELFILGNILFLLGTAIVVTVTRISYGEAGLLTSRYKIYSILFLITIYLAFISKLNLTKDKWIVSALIFMAICFNFMANYSHFKDVINFRNQLISFGVNWQLEETKPDLNTALKLYELPNLGFENNLEAIKKPVQNSPAWQENITKSTNSDGILIQNNSFIFPQNKEDNISVIVQSNKRNYLMPVQLMSYPLKSFVRTGKYWQNGFFAVLNYNEFENGTYQLGLMIKEGLLFKKYYLKDSLIVNVAKPKSVKTNW